MSTERLKMMQQAPGAQEQLDHRDKAGVAKADLLRDTESLSIQQMVKYYTLIMVHKVTMTGKPAYLAEQLKLKDESARELQARKRTTSFS